AGQELLRVQIGGEAGALPVFYPNTLGHSTAGVLWAAESWTYFFRCRDQEYFVWRVSSGQRLCLQVSNEPKICQIDSEMLATCLRTESETLAEFFGAHEPELLALETEWIGTVFHEGKPSFCAGLMAALSLILGNRSAEFIPQLRRLERLPNANNWTVSTGCKGLPGFSMMYGVRPLVIQALKAVGQAPAGFATYRFS
ncbi:unnamed protein product, partial [Phaeothamnion confervicola]